MQMNRVERKRLEKKFQKYKRVYFFILAVLLICALITVDFQVRFMLGIDEYRLIGYEQIKNNEYIILLMGKEYLIDTLEFKNIIDNLFAELAEMTYNIKIWIKNMQ